MVPAKLNAEGNDQYGDCVSAEEAAAISAYSVLCGNPEKVVPAATCVSWAQAGGFLNGADLTSVMDAMARSGMVDTTTNSENRDGPYAAVDYSNESILQSAISQGPVKIGIDADACQAAPATSRGGWR